MSKVSAKQTIALLTGAILATGAGVFWYTRHHKGDRYYLCKPSKVQEIAFKKLIQIEQKLFKFLKSCKKSYLQFSKTLQLLQSILVNNQWEELELRILNK